MEEPWQPNKGFAPFFSAEAHIAKNEILCKTRRSSYAYQNRHQCDGFPETGSKCRSEVLFETPEGDSIALKSTLSQYIFCNIAQNVPLLESGSIRFSRKADEEILKEYLCE